jgi:two-component system, NtrC family, C4-dicarboxylate transport response regulator DctD
MQRIFLVDDDPALLESYGQTLELADFTVIRFSKASNAIADLAKYEPLAIITDVRMPDMDGLTLLDRIISFDSTLPVIMISGHADVPMALDAMRGGAWDLLEKPADPVRLIEVVRRAVTHRYVILENRALRAAASGSSTIETTLIGASLPMTNLRRQISTLAATEIDVLLTGETGVGKDMVARALHAFGPRSSRNFVAINCGAIPETMIESELFGHEAGAFTGAKEKRIGKIEHADGGTLFLDEIESMPLSSQIRLLRVLQERSLERIGSNKSIPLNLRVIAAAKGDLHIHAKEGRFRSDLAFRLDVARLAIPALRERREDVPLLLLGFMATAAARHNIKDFKPPSQKSLEILSAHEWPGNVREVRNVAERLVLGLSEPLLHTSLNQDALSDQQEGAMAMGETSLAEQMKKYEVQLIAQALEAQGGRMIKTAQILGISRKTLYLKMREHSLGGDGALQE